MTEVHRRPQLVAEGHGPAHQPAPRAVEPWPQGVSRRATMRISDVLAELGPEFPAVSTSKLRFLEEQGLVEPVRTPSGYRHYSPADVERLRFVLRQQRDRYLPLRVIGEQLAELDRGEHEQVPSARLVAQDGERTDLAVAGRHTVASLAREAGLDEADVAELVAAGVVQPGPAGHFAPGARDVVAVAAALREHGIDVRHLRSIRAAADRQVDLVDQVVAPLRSGAGATAGARAAAVAGEVGELLIQLHTSLVRAGVARVSL